jgi:hypothetical protein
VNHGWHIFALRIFNSYMYFSTLYALFRNYIALSDIDRFRDVIQPISASGHRFLITDPLPDSYTPFQASHHFTSRQMPSAPLCTEPTRFCDDYDDSHDSITGKLQVVGADIELPQIEVLLQHGSETGLENVAVCLMQQHNRIGGPAIENNGQGWVLGLYVR